MNCEDFKKRLQTYSREDIVITDHAWEQSVFRNISLDEVRKNILNPKRLQIVLEQPSKRISEEKFDCYFGYSKTQCHRYILVLKKKCVVCTVIKINRRWQKRFEKHVKI